MFKTVLPIAHLQPPEPLFPNGIIFLTLSSGYGLFDTNYRLSAGPTELLPVQPDHRHKTGRHSPPASLHTCILLCFFNTFCH